VSFQGSAWVFKGTECTPFFFLVGGPPAAPDLWELLAAKGDTGISGYEFIQGDTVTIQNLEVLTVTRTCPAGKKIISGGFWLEGTLSNPSPGVVLAPPNLMQSAPINDTTWEVKVEQVGGDSRNFWIPIICVNVQ
jgi:hypothetical protein